MKKPTLIVIGGGAAGFFGALSAKELCPNLHVFIAEKTGQVLSKVRISGGGRCNVTHNCFDPKALVERYPRGKKELLGPFHRFQPKDMIAWLAKRGVDTKIEADGRIFPSTNTSQTIISCFTSEAKQHDIEVKLFHNCTSITRKDSCFTIQWQDGTTDTCDYVLFATGSARSAYQILEELGHTIIPPVPSLFTFNTPHSPYKELAGLSIQDAELTLPKTSFVERGPLLFTHTGISGPAVLRLSAWAARYLHEIQYKTELQVNWLPKIAKESFSLWLQEKRTTTPTKLVANVPFHLPMNFWKKICEQSGASSTFSHLSKAQEKVLIHHIYSDCILADGKTTYIDEFVTAGGISLKDVHFQTMESKIVPNVFFAGEVLDIDGITGGFNFQNAWTTSRIVAETIQKRVEQYEYNSF